MLQFQKKFLDNNEDGGKEAADEMLARIKEYAKSLELDVDNMDIMVQAYANFEGLGKACIRRVKMKVNADLSSFASGLMKRHGLFKFVDVGPGKEEADERIRRMKSSCSPSLNNRLTIAPPTEALDSYINMELCKHAIIGVCHDSGYAPYLRKYATDGSTRDRITLLEGGPIHPSIAALDFKRTLKLDTVFAPLKTLATPSQGRKKSRKVLRLAAVHSSDRIPAIQRNRAGKRVDKPLQVDAGGEYVKTLVEANLCFGYHLRGKCDDRACGKKHTKTEHHLTDEAF